MSIGLILFVKNTMTKKFLEQLHENGIFIARHFADMSISYVLTGDNSALQTIANNYKNSHNDINYIFIQDSHGNVLVHTFNQGFPSELKDANILGPDQTYSAKRLTMKKGVIIFNVASPISSKTEAEHTHGTHAELKSQKDTSHILERVGVVHIGFSEENIENYAAKITNLGIEIAIIVLILGVGGAVVFATVITKPVLELTKGVEAVGSGNLNYKVHVKTKDEVGKLSESFNEMVEKLRTAKEEIIKTNRELELEIIERKMAKQRLQIEKDRLQNFLDITTLMIAAIDSDQLVSLINKKGCEILGYSENEIVGKNWFDNFIPERNRDEGKTVFEKLITGEIKPSEYYENPVLTRNRNI
ncbi:MAG: HAMP domain-containing protein [Nitrospirae bacterium]|nr:HAMP domain-containing protein [Nitrospirota bacterium]